MRYVTITNGIVTGVQESATVPAAPDGSTVVQNNFAPLGAGYDGTAFSRPPFALREQRQKRAVLTLIGVTDPQIQTAFIEAFS